MFPRNFNCKKFRNTKTKFLIANTENKKIDEKSKKLSSLIEIIDLYTNSPSVINFTIGNKRAIPITSKKIKIIAKRKYNTNLLLNFGSIKFFIFFKVTSMLIVKNHHQ